MCQLVGFICIICKLGAYITKRLPRTTDSGEQEMPATVERAIKCLALIRQSDSGTTVTELAAQLETSVASTSRLVQTLRQADLVTRDDRSGRLYAGLGLWELGSAAAARLTIRRVV